LLIRIIKNIYKFIIKRLAELLVKRKIIYNLLWALFKVNNHIIIIYYGSGKLKYITYNFGEKKETK
jgi:hypothetical protein